MSTRELSEVLHREIEPEREVDRSELMIKNLGYADYKV